MAEIKIAGKATAGSHISLGGTKGSLQDQLDALAISLDSKDQLKRAKLVAENVKEIETSELLQTLIVLPILTEITFKSTNQTVQELTDTITEIIQIQQTLGAEINRRIPK